MFGSYSPVLDASYPLWFATYDNVEVRSSHRLHCISAEIPFPVNCSRLLWEPNLEGQYFP